MSPSEGGQDAPLYSTSLCLSRAWAPGHLPLSNLGTARCMSLIPAPRTRRQSHSTLCQLWICLGDTSASRKAEGHLV